MALGSVSQSIARTNILHPYDINFKHNKKEHIKNISWRAAFGISQKARNPQGKKVSSPQYLYAEQNALAMLKGMGASAEATAIAQEINVNDDNGVRGHYVVTGDFKIPFQFILDGQYHFDREWIFSIHIPFYHMKFDNIVWDNKTKNVTGDDVLTRELLTNNFFSNVARLGGGLDLQDWNQRGIGDVTCMVSWSREFFQNKKWLKQVNITVRAGTIFPTGFKKDEKKAFAVAFGNDGAYSIPFGAGLDLRFKEYAWVGVNATFEHIFSHTKMRRIMTDAAQTNYLLLQTANTRKEYGFVQVFNIYVEPKITDALSLRFAYVHQKNGDEKLFILSEDYSTIVANQDPTLEETTTHDFLMQFKWDGAKLKPEALFQPNGSIFLQTPFNGRGVLQSGSVGVSLSVDF